MTYHILIVEDDSTINQIIAEVLSKAEYQVTSVADGGEALQIIRQKAFDLVILDIMLPSMNGLDLLKEVRTFSQVPIVMLTALDDEYTQLLSFNQTISDYITKPFSPVILLKRIENILRHHHNPSELRLQDLYIQFDEFSVTWKDKPIELTKKQFQILEVLAKRHGSLVTRSQMMQAVWGYDELESRVLDNHIKHIRQKLPDVPLKTMKGLGYSLDL